MSGATTALECCVGTDDGMSFQDGSGTCTKSQCVGMFNRGNGASPLDKATTGPMFG